MKILCKLLFFLIVIATSCSKNSPEEVVPVSGLQLNKHELRLEKGGSDVLAVTITPANATDKTVSWVSTNPGVATVSDGIVIAVSTGTTEVIAKSGNYFDKCVVSVVIPATSINLNASKLEMIVGETMTLSATVLPKDATEVVEWSSSDESVATVDKGLIRAIAEGETTISAKVGELVATCEVLVKPEPTTVTGRFIDSKTGESVQFGPSDTFQIIEEGFDTEEAQSWYMKPDGTYVNKLVNIGNYRMHSLEQNFYPVENLPFEIKKGDNVVDFTVTPYARIKDVSFSYDATTKKLVAKFKVEHADPAKTNSMTVKFLVNNSRWVGVGDEYNFIDEASATMENAPAGMEITLMVDKDGKNFKYKKPYYLRIGAVATGTNVNTNKRFNFSAVYKIDEDFQKVWEILDW